MLRRPWIGLVGLALALLLGLAAIVDHHQKNVRTNRAELAEWYCTHAGTRCGGPSSAVMERRWDEREVGYEIAVGCLGVFGTASLVGSRRR
jgi:hypothetical protein